MNTFLPPKRRRRGGQPDELVTKLSQKIIGQKHAMESIVPFVRMYEAGLSPEGRPPGVFLLLGPTGTGKTRTVEVLAEALHGSPRNLLRIDCGEYQMEHEVAKLVGAPPGYLGHRETHPILTQPRLAAITSAQSSLSILLFDEIEKAAPSLTRLLLGVLDKAQLRLGDNNLVNFERTMIFLTSNVGARQMQDALKPGLGFRDPAATPDLNASRLESMATLAARRSFAPEFINRVDAVITYQPLDMDTLEAILDLQLHEFEQHIRNRLGARAFDVNVTPRARLFLLRSSTSREYGARDLRRAVHRHVAQPVASLVVQRAVRPGGSVRVDCRPNGEALTIRAA